MVDVAIEVYDVGLDGVRKTIELYPCECLYDYEAEMKPLEKPISFTIENPGKEDIRDVFSKLRRGYFKNSILVIEVDYHPIDMSKVPLDFKSTMSIHLIPIKRRVRLKNTAVIKAWNDGYYQYLKVVVDATKLNDIEANAFAMDVWDASVKWSASQMLGMLDPLKALHIIWASYCKKVESNIYWATVTGRTVKEKGCTSIKVKAKIDGNKQGTAIMQWR